MTDETHQTRLEKLLPLLACPACKVGLRPSGDALTCSQCGTKHPMFHGRPAFLPGGAEPKLMSADHVSNQPPSDLFDQMVWQKGWVLNLGAGGTAKKLDHVVEVEYSVFRNTDVAADAHTLPFADGVFDAAVTFNTFEHLADPPKAAAEVFRVLKPGGKLILHTAFLQPVHEPPYHFYNTTEYGLRRWFSAFDIDSVTVSNNFHPGYVFAWLSSVAMYAVGAVQGANAQKTVADTTLGYWAERWADPKIRDADGGAWQILRTLPQDWQKMFAAGFQLTATKPV